MKSIYMFLDRTMNATKQHYADRMNTGVTQFDKLADTFLVTKRLALKEKLFSVDAQLVIDAASIEYVNSELNAAEYMDIVQHIKEQIL